MIKYFKNSTFAIVLILMSGCRQTYEPTDSDLSNFGWNYYEEGRYDEAFDWFLQAITEDPSYVDAYNGIGWTLGRMGQPALAVDYFSTAVSELFPPEEEFKEYKLDYYAGLAFGYNAIGNDAQALNYAKTLFFGNFDNIIGDDDWCFCHEEHINQIDVRLIQAVSEYRLGLFSDCIATINKAYGNLTNSLDVAINSNSLSGEYLDLDGNFEFNSGDFICNGEWADTDQDNQLDEGEERYFDEYPLNIDHTTVSGRAILANHLALLASYTSINNEVNGLNCNCTN